MKKRILSLLMTLLVAVCFVPTLAFADETGMKTVTINVGGANGEYEDYEITATEIKLLKENTIYELTGTTDKKINMWGSNPPDAVKTLYLKLNNASLNGGFELINSYGAKLAVEVPKGTTNTVKKLYAVDLSITGAGTLNSGDLGVTQQSSSDSRKLTSRLYIKDTKIAVTQPSDIGNSSEWNGECVLDGNANVTYISTTSYSALKLGQTSSIKHSLTMKDNAKLYCLQKNADDPVPGYVSGIEAFHGASITLQDNAYLEAQGRDGIVDSQGEYTAGRGIESNSDILVKDNATLKATAYGPAISTWGNVKADGGKIIANSSGSNGIYAAKAIEIKNADAEISGYYPAIFGGEGVILENSTVKAISEADCAIYAHNDDAAVTIKNSIVNARGADNCYGIYGKGGIKASDSWIQTTGPETMDSGSSSITNSVLFNGNTGKTIGNHKIPGNVEVTKDMTLAIDKDTSIAVPDKTTFTNHGIINVKGSFVKEEGGTVICDSHNGGTATCTKKAACDICQTEYGEVDPFKHEALKHVPANAATKDQEGNTEYWYCEACGKYFADEKGKEEIQQADTVIAKLPADPANPTGGKEKDQTSDSSASTGDDANLALWAALLMLSGCAAGGTVLYRRKQN